MATPRLPFLWPFLFKQIRPTAAHTSRRGLHSATTRRQNLSGQRYGTANEPPPELRQPPPQPGTTRKDVKPESKPQPKGNGKQKKDKVVAKDKEAAKQPSEAAVKEVDAIAAKADNDKVLKLPDPTGGAPAVLSLNQGSPPPAEEKPPDQAPSQTASSQTTPSQRGSDFQPPTPVPPSPILPQNALSAVLNMPPPSSGPDSSTASATPPTPPYYHENDTTSDEHKPPHINTPRFIHHFDTWGLVKKLAEGNWTEDQAITIMKAVRLILADNIDLARDGLVSKSNVENETYLFRAACSELRTEVSIRRKAEIEKSRTERGGLQHDTELLGQRLGMEIAGLKEELRGMVEGRKMEVREEGRGVDSKIQELNYRITVALNSDSKSDVESVRWLITRRAIVALFICVIMVLGSLKYASSTMQQEEEAKKRAAASKKMMQSVGGGGGRDEGRDGRDGDGSLGGAGQLVVGQGDNPSYISLG